MSAIILGSDAFQWAGHYGIACTRKRRLISPQYGRGYEYEFEGTPAAILAASWALYEDQEAVIEESGPIHRMTVKTGADPSESSSSVETHTYELPGNSIQRDIREHPLAKALKRITVARISKLLRSDQVITDLNADYVALGDAETIPARKAFATTLFNAMARRDGNMSFQVSQYVFRVTTIVSRRSTYAVAYANVNKIYTFVQLSTETNPPAEYLVSLTKIETKCAPTSTPLGYTWGWLKQTPAVSTAPGNRIAIQSEYWLEEWEDWVYGGVA